MAYAYTQTIQYGSASDGWVKFSITPGPEVPVSPGETVTVSGQIYDTDGDVDRIRLFTAAGVTTDEWGETALTEGALLCAEQAVSAPRGKATVFSLSFTATEEMAGLLADIKGQLYLDFRLSVWGTHSSSKEYSETLPNCAWTLLARRAAPVITSAMFSDEGTALSQVGYYVQGKSLLRFDSGVTTDPNDATVTVEKRELVIGGHGYALEADGQSLGAPDMFTSEIAWTYTVTDSKGLTAQAGGTLAWLPYAKPEITAWSAERYSVKTLESGDTVYGPDDDSPLVWVNLTAQVSALNGVNAWSAQVGAGAYSHAWLSGADGRALSVVRDMDAVDTELSEAADWTLTITLADLFETVECVCSVPKAGGLLNIEKTGVAVGTRSTGTESAPLFEVAYRAKFSGGCVNSAGLRFDNAQPGRALALEGCAAYSEEDAPYIRRAGYFVHISGAIKLNAGLGSGNSVELCNVLDDMYRPPRRVIIMRAAMNGQAVEYLIEADGRVTLYNRGGSTLSTSALIPMVLTWMVDNEVTEDADA